MKKNKKMIVALLAIVLTLSIGYALFSQTINITGSATASGSFEFTPVCTIGVDSGIIPQNGTAATEAASIISKYNTLMTATSNDLIPTTIAGSSNNTCTVSGNTVTISTTLAYPGAMSMFTVKITNTGTVSGMFGSDNSLLIAGTSNGVADANIAIYIDGVNGMPSTVAAVEAYQTSIESHVFAPNDTVYLVYAFYWDPDSTTSCSGNSCQDTFTYTIPFVQAN